LNASLEVIAVCWDAQIKEFIQGSGDIFEGFNGEFEASSLLYSRLMYTDIAAGPFSAVS